MTSLSRGPLVHAIELSLGCMFIGTVLNCVLFGVATVQVYMYANKFTRDPWPLKAVVGFIYIADLIDSVNICIMMWYYLIHHYGDPAYATQASVFFYLFPSLGVATTLPCHLFLAWRLSYFAHRWWIVIPIVTFAIISSLAGIGTSIAISILVEFAKFSKLRPVACTWRATGFLTDFLITCATIWNLKHSRTGFSKTDQSISRLANLSLQTGLITCLWSALILALFSPAAPSLGLIFAVFSISSPKIIANSTYTVILAGRADAGNEENSTSALVDPPSFFDPPTAEERRRSYNSESKGQQHRKPSTPFSLQLVDMIRPKVTAVQVVTVNETEERVDELEYASRMTSREGNRSAGGNMTPSPSTQKSQLEFESDENDDEKRGVDYFSRGPDRYF